MQYGWLALNLTRTPAMVRTDPQAVSRAPRHSSPCLSGGPSSRPGSANMMARLAPLLGDPSAIEAMRILGEDFGDHDSVGPRRVAEFLLGIPDDDIQPDVVGFVRELLERCG